MLPNEYVLSTAAASALPSCPPAASSLSVMMDLGKNENSSEATASTTSRASSELIHNDEESQNGAIPITESNDDTPCPHVNAISSNDDDVPRRENHSRQGAQQQDLEGNHPAEDDVISHDGSYVVSVSSVSVGEKICCGVVPPRFSLAASVVFIVGILCLLAWLTENDHIS